MTSFTLNTFSSTQETLATGDYGVIGPQGGLSTNGYSGIIGVGSFGLSVFGSLDAYNSVCLYSGAISDATVFVGASGSISSSNAEAIFGFVSNSFSLANNGTIFGQQRGIYLVDNATATFSIINTGSITSSTYAAIEMLLDSGTLRVTNSGTIANAGLGSAISVLGSPESSVEIVNSGTISAAGTTSSTIFLASGKAVLSNSGAILGDVWVLGSSTGDITNTGLIQGDLLAAEGADRIDLRGGQVTGTVDGGLGGDTYLIDRTSQILIDSGAGYDKVLSEASYRLADNLEELTLLGSGNLNGAGNAAANAVTGNAGDNRLSGLAGNDTLNGDLGQDRMLGGANNDTMLGGDGDDTVLGGAGNDTARGEDGDDLLNGGAGTDLVAGGTGLDVFVFSALGHTTNSLATADIISDFVRGEDKVDLSAIDAISTNATPDNAFTFIGAGAFSNVAGQLRYSQLAGYTNVEMDLDGNGTIDGIVRLFGTLTLNASDFVL